MEASRKHEKLPSLPPAAQAFFVHKEVEEEASVLWIMSDIGTFRHVRSALTTLRPSTPREFPHLEDHEHNGDGLSRTEKIDLAGSLLPLLRQEPGVTLLLSEQLQSPVPTAHSLLGNDFILKVGQAADPTAVSKQLTAMGYEKEKEIEEPGTFALKGEVLEIALPLRTVRITWAFNLIERVQNLGTNENQDIAHIPPIDGFEADGGLLLDLLQTLDTTVLIEDDPEGIDVSLDEKNASTLDRIRNVFEKHITFPSFHEKDDPEPIAHRLPPHKTLLEQIKKGSKKEVSVFTHHPETAKTLLPEAEIKTLPSDTPPFPGFSSDSWNQTVVTDYDLTELTGPLAPKPRTKIDTAFIQSLTPGDFVVHIDHGVAEFKGTEFQEIDKGEREFLVLAYAESDRLLVPVEYSDKVSKYLGSGAPKVHRLHGANWHHVKQRVKEDAERLAQDLLAAATNREAQQGFVFESDSEELTKLIRDFPYEETPDQQKAWEEIRNEMEGLPHPESKKPMDRLLAGDVGFGKTELAIRAAYKAIEAKKQVMILAPTTILAQQHFDTFSERLKETGASLGLLTRFETASEQRTTARDFADGKIDILIGTHRLLSRDIHPADLGLLIVDEEQKFGVKQKDHLKRIRANVDVLSLSATPIPRSLHAAIGGIRTLSTITTPPKGRKPVSTIIAEYNDAAVDEAIAKETTRKGQVFYLHNRVATIDAQAKRLRARYTDLTIETAHGQMPEKELADKMHRFTTKEIDILVCTTIVENGLDLPNVNTLIVHDATRLGLSQLYQLRGRIGRGEREAFSLFFYHREKLTGVAKERLQALQAAQRLGSGLELAMRDMEIRGAGNLLGKEQSGRINAIGIALYARLLSQAVEKLSTGEYPPELMNVSIDLPFDAFFPKTYIEDNGERLETYQRLSAAASRGEETLQEERERIEQLHGLLPQEAKNFVVVMHMKILAAQAHISNIDTQIVSGLRGAKTERVVITFKRPPHPKRLYGFIADHPEWESPNPRILRAELKDLKPGWQEKLHTAIEAFIKKK